MKKLILTLALILTLPMQAQTPRFVGTTNGWAPWSGSDKMQHFTTGIPGGLLAGVLLKDTKHPILYSWLIGLAIGLYKEESDRRGKSTIFGPAGTAEWADAFNTSLGFAAGAAFDYYVIGVSVRKETLPNGKTDTVTAVSYRVKL